MFAMWLVGAVSLVFGRVYCAYACPQTVFTELAHDADAIAQAPQRGGSPRRGGRGWRAVSRSRSWRGLSLVAPRCCMAYFAPLPDVAARASSISTSARGSGAVGAITTLLAFLDFAFVRETFCRSACPYGLLQGVIEDGRSLHVRLDETTGRVHRLQGLRAGVPDGDRHPRRLLPDRVHALRLVHRRLRRRSSAG